MHSPEVRCRSSKTAAGHGPESWFDLTVPRRLLPIHPYLPQIAVIWETFARNHGVNQPCKRRFRRCVLPGYSALPRTTLIATSAGLDLPGARSPRELGVRAEGGKTLILVSAGADPRPLGPAGVISRLQDLAPRRRRRCHDRSRQRPPWTTACVSTSWPTSLRRTGTVANRGCCPVQPDKAGATG